MNWQPVPRIEQGGQYASHGDPFAMQAGAAPPQIMGPGLSAEEQHFLSSCTTREYEEMARRKAEHMESAEHIAPQHNYPIPGKTSRYICVRSCCGMSERRTGARTQFVPRPGALRLQLDSEIVPKLPGEAHAAARASATSVV
jgi:hypothetical protein